MSTTAIQPPVGTHPNSARGEVLLPIAQDGKPDAVRFSLRTLHDYTTRTGTKLADIGQRLADDFLTTVAELVTSAVRTCVPGAVQPAGYRVGDALDLLDRLTTEQTSELVAAIMQAIRIDQTPLFQALIAQAPKQSAPEMNGASTSTSPTEN